MATDDSKYTVEPKSLNPPNHAGTPSPVSRDSRSIGPVTTATTGAAAVTLLVCWILRDFAGVDVPADVQGAITIILVIIAGWLVPGRKGDHEA